MSSRTKGDLFTSIGRVLGVAWWPLLKIVALICLADVAILAISVLFGNAFCPLALHRETRLSSLSGGEQRGFILLLLGWYLLSVSAMVLAGATVVLTVADAWTYRRTRRLRDNLNRALKLLPDLLALFFQNVVWLVVGLWFLPVGVLSVTLMTFTGLGMILENRTPRAAAQRRSEVIWRSPEVVFSWAVLVGAAFYGFTTLSFDFLMIPILGSPIFVFGGVLPTVLFLEQTRQLAAAPKPESAPRDFRLRSMR